MPVLIADGHHRSTLPRVGAEKAQQNANHQGMRSTILYGCMFPANQLTIIDYNCVVKT